MALRWSIPVSHLLPPKLGPHCETYASCPLLLVAGRPLLGARAFACYHVDAGLDLAGQSLAGLPSCAAARCCPWAEVARPRWGADSMAPLGGVRVLPLSSTPWKQSP